LEDIIRAVHDAADGTGLFGKGDVKVRVNLFEHYSVGGRKSDFVHTIAYILSGRTEEQRKNLSVQIVKALKGLLPEVPIISIDIREINRATYNNRNTV
jgi:5-carboxymethyl-2-hydroxymuconate isomerase